VDLWGVVHDGVRPYDGVVDALDRLAALGDKRVLFVTNTSRAADAVIATLVDAMGIDRSLFHDVVSSGDVTRVALRSETGCCFHYGDASFVPWLFELPFSFTEDVARADFIVASGAPRTAAGLETARALLAPAAARGIRLVCTNPDEIIPNATGDTLGPGAVARAYAELGGAVFLYGKPHAPIYAEARRRLGHEATRRLVAIGDLIETDIRGARDAGIPSVLVTRGRTVPIATNDAVPDMTIERFVW
jgi:HAD superfamily hydrolase (TIGR01459 family)